MAHTYGWAFLGLLAGSTMLAEVWAARLTGLTCFVAGDPQPLGFMALRADGYLDLAFVAFSTSIGSCKTVFFVS